jgi:PAS domain S-box-containing protein
MADLQKQVGALTRELEEAREQQTATAEMLQVINSSPGNLAPVFAAILEKATRLCGAKFGILWLYDGGRFIVADTHAVPAALVEFLVSEPVRVADSASLVDIVRGQNLVHVPDLAATELYHAGNPARRAYVNLGGARTLISVALRKDNALLGAFNVFRQEVRPFSDKEIALVQNFAAQAVIAMENARLFNETREALERQTATADILKVIASSPANVQPVFDAIATSVNRLLGGFSSSVNLFIDGIAHLKALTSTTPDGDEMLKSAFPRPVANFPRFKRAQVGEIEQIADTEAMRDDDEELRDIARARGFRSVVFAPLMNKGVLIGLIGVSRVQPGSFAEHDLQLLQAFADQAVIAIENARLFEEVRARTRELTESLEQQTATSNVLQVISSSPGELKPVFQALLENATRVCGANCGTMNLYYGDNFEDVAFHNVPPAFARAHDNKPFRPHPRGLLSELVRTRQVVTIDDLRTSPAYLEGNPTAIEFGDIAGARTVVIVPMLKDAVLIGAITLYRGEVRPFAEKQIELVSNFAKQAVIAIENTRLLKELRQSLQRQTATADVLKVISRSSVDLETVLDTLVETVMRLCRADQAYMLRRRNDKYHNVASRGLSQEAKDYFLAHPGTHDRSNTAGRVAVERRVVHIPDVMQDPDYTYREGQKLAGHRTMLGIPLLREDTLVGIFVVTRTRVEPFTDKEIELASTFADQAVIAIENARLFEELRDRQTELARSVDELTATGDVLKIISRSPVDLERVLDTLVETVTRLCRADQANMVLRRGDIYYSVAERGFSEEAGEHFRTHPVAPSRGTIRGRVALERRAVHIPDVLQDPEYTYSEGQKLAGYRTMLGIPLLREDTVIGMFNVTRTRVEPFTDKEIELATTFADQAVIAIENARLFEELRDRQAELARSVDELTATGDVLKIISRSSVNLETVLETLVETVARLCRADQAVMHRRQDDKYHLVAECGLSSAAKEFILAHPPTADRGTISGRVASERRTVHIPDVLEDPGYTYTEAQSIAGHRTGLGIPLLREDTLVGIFVIARKHVEPFTDKEVELVTTFADQAVIAIENARLFEELRERQAELRVTFDNMGDGVVMFGADTRLVAWNRNFQEILDLPDHFLAQRPSYIEYFRYLAERGEYSADLEAELGRTLDDTTRELRFERTRPDGRVIEVRRNPVPGGGFVLIYADITERKRAEEAIRVARDAAETALRELQIAQASLVHAQKMAALGQVTAGIAHEIKNPLNFVNNFASLSVELLDELKHATAQAMGALDPGKRSEIVETIGMLTGNLERIVEHGRRADGIVRSMLQHSRGGSGDWQATDLNALVEEALNLAYHGARAQDQSFEIKLERDLGRDLAPVDVVPQELIRVLINLIGNGFYAANKRSLEGDGTYRPTLKVTTRELGERVEVRVRDNGVGIPPEHREKLFQPFFTTKPTGEGTGLGLSISYEIVAQQHGGTITVDSEVGEFTEFTVRLPRRGRAVAG